jgi:hypothetical protein
MKTSSITKPGAMFAFAAVLTVVPAWAHHAFAAEFDEKRTVKLHGKVNKVELINPNTWIYIDVKGPDGAVVNWAIEGGSPNALFRLGFTKESLPIGTEVVLNGYQAKDGSNRAVGKEITYTDGKRLFLGGSAPGTQGDAPDEKK